MTGHSPNYDRILYALSLTAALYGSLLALGGRPEDAQALAALFTGLLPYTDRRP